VLITSAFATDVTKMLKSSETGQEGFALEGLNIWISQLVMDLHGLL
jgi:hypothetical protein